MDLILLTDAAKCPKCFHPHKIPSYGQCRNCGMMLFDHSHDFKKYEQETGWREYWVFTREHGWMHSTQVDNPNPNPRFYKEPNLPENYGTESYLEEKRKNAYIEKEEALKSRKKGRFSAVFSKS